jgi:hypothetical protein
VTTGRKSCKEFKRLTYKIGKLRLRTHTLRNPAPTKEIEKRVHLSQVALASLTGVSMRTVQVWEQGLRAPQRASAIFAPGCRTTSVRFLVTVIIRIHTTCQKLSFPAVPGCSEVSFGRMGFSARIGDREVVFVLNRMG